MNQVRSAARLAGLVMLPAIAAACASAGGTPRRGNPVPVTPAVMRDSLGAMLAHPDFANAHWGILIVDPERGDTLYSHNAGKLFMPASNMKIVTGAIALSALGPEFRFRTDFATSGAVRDGALEGDLLVIGRGDPSLSEHMRGDAMAPFREIADSLVARGIRRIAGEVRAHGDAFPDAIHGFGWAWDDFDYAYSAGIDELYFNEGFYRVVAYGGVNAGDTVSVRTHAAGLPPVEVEAVTVDRSGYADSDTAAPRTRARLHRQDDGTLVVRGTVLVGDSAALAITQPDPAAAYLAALRTALHERGIEVAARDTAATGHVGSAPAIELPTGSDPPLDTLFTFWSPPLAEILPALEKPSQNQIAEILFKTLALEVTGVGTADSARTVVERQLVAWGIDSTGFAIRDGSGLSRHNYLTPETVVRVLDRVRADTAFRHFHDALPIAGVDGTIETRMRGTPAEGNLRAKTGTLDKARALSGYVTTADGRLLIFSTFANNYTVPTRRVDAVTNALGAMLASMRLDR